MADTVNDNEQIKEVITPEAPAKDADFELWDLDHDGIPDLLEDDEDVDAASDGQRIASAISHRAVTMTVEAGEDTDVSDNGTGSASAYYVADHLQDAGYDDDEDEDDYEDEYEEDDEEDLGPVVAPQFLADGASADGKDELPIINGRRVERRKKPRVKKDPELDLTHPDYTLTITKGLTNQVVKRRYYPHNRAIFTVVALFLLSLLLLCFFVFSVVYMIGNERLKRTQATEIAQLEEENSLLASKNNELSSTVTQLSRSVNRSIEDRRADEIAYEASLVPDGYPLSEKTDMKLSYEAAPEENTEQPEDDDADDASEGDSADAANSASSEDTGDGEETDDTAAQDKRIPVVLFSPDNGTLVVASGGGAVTRVTDDDTYGCFVMIDHRNGYQSIYRCDSEPLVGVGDTLTRGDTIFVFENHEDADADEEDDADAGDSEVDEETDKTANAGGTFAYQILLNGNYINPRDIMQSP